MFFLSATPSLTCTLPNSLACTHIARATPYTYNAQCTDVLVYLRVCSYSKYETPFQRLERLRAETQELEHYLQHSSGDLGSMYKATNALSITALVEDLERVQATFQRLLTAQDTGVTSSADHPSDAAASCSSPADVIAAASVQPLSRTLTEQLQQFSAVQYTAAPAAAAAAAASPTAAHTPGMSVWLSCRCV
jgi:hypothetical protein